MPYKSIVIGKLLDRWYFSFLSSVVCVASFVESSVSQHLNFISFILRDKGWVFTPPRCSENSEAPINIRQ